MKKYLAKLGKASSYFFFSGFVLSKAQYLVIPGISSLLAVASLGFNLLGYSLWLMATFFYPNHKRLEKEWFAFHDFSEQHKASATIGVIATLLALAAVFFSWLLIPATWLILSSNIIWSTSEYHKLKNPPPADTPFSESHQRTYLSYALTMSTLALVTAASTSLIFLFPPATIFIILTSTILSMGLGVLAADCWLNYTFGEHQPSPVISSYKDMKHSLGSTIAQEDSHDHLFNYEGVFKAQNNEESLKEQSSQNTPIAVLR